MKTNKNQLKEVSKILELEDNKVLIELYGQHDENLTKIENNFGIHISYRGNIIEFRGNEDACSSASKFISSVYKKLINGKKINEDIFDDFSKNSKQSDAEDLNTILIKTKKKNIYPRSANQLKFVNLIKDKDLVFAVGPAGTGKTYLAVACAVEALLKKEISKIILSRPAVEAGERLGFLPGDLKEKIDPYLRPLYDALNDLIPSKTLERYLENNTIEIAPLAFMRGRTLENSYIILDEAQNTSSMQMKMFLTRLGKNSKMVIAGDSTQVDLPRGEKSGLKEILNIMPRIYEIGKVLFKKDDITRHSLVTKIVEAYEKNNKALSKSE
jgi:phosphate starvation-inducible PhoH-like protein